MSRPLAIAFLVAAGCSSSWTEPVAGLNRMVLSSWGDGQGRAFFAGGALGDTEGPLALAFDPQGDGGAWHELPAAATVSAKVTTLWWVHGFTGPTTPNVWFCGEQGTVLTWNGSAFSSLPTGTTATLYGLWGATPDDVWAVGGVPDVSSVALHFDGTTWSPATLPANGGAYFKVWGSSASDVFVVGQRGKIFHFDGAAWTPMTSGVGDTVTLLTVAGRSSSDVYAVGGLGLGTAIHYDGSAWSPVAGLDLSTTSGLTGVAVSPSGDVSIVGLAGTKLRLRAGSSTWINDSMLEPHLDLHGTWLDSADDLFAVGGNLNAPPGSARDGVVAHYGGGLASYAP